MIDRGIVAGRRVHVDLWRGCAQDLGFHEASSHGLLRLNVNLIEPVSVHVGEEIQPEWVLVVVFSK